MGETSTEAGELERTRDQVTGLANLLEQTQVKLGAALVVAETQAEEIEKLRNQAGWPGKHLYDRVNELQARLATQAEELERLRSAARAVVEWWDADQEWRGRTDTFDTLLEALEAQLATQGDQEP